MSKRLGTSALDVHGEDICQNFRKVNSVGLKIEFESVKVKMTFVPSNEVRAVFGIANFFLDEDKFSGICNLK